MDLLSVNDDVANMLRWAMDMDGREAVLVPGILLFRRVTIDPLSVNGDVAMIFRWAMDMDR